MTSDEASLIDLTSELAETEFPEMISISVICRLCANQSDKLISIYSEDGISNDLAGKINLYLPVKVMEEDSLPLQCCWQCASTILAWHDLVVTSVEADRRLRSYQFVTEKQLEEITSSYGGNDSILTPSDADETLHKATPSVSSPKKPSSPRQFSRNIKENNSRPSDLECLSIDANTEDNNASEETVLPEENNSVNIPKNNKTDANPKEKNINVYYKACANYCCNICGRTFDLKVKLKTHLRDNHHTKTPKVRRKQCDVIKTFKCAWCDKSYTKKHDLGRHLQSKHGQTNVSNNSKNNKAILKTCQISNAQYKCDICSKSFTKGCNLLRHRTIHDVDNLKLYCCSECGKGFRLNMSLTRHITEVHNDSRKFECNVCKVMFKSKWSRDEHLNVHSDSRPYVCDICGKAFRQNASLYVHKQYHSSDYPHECAVCHKKFQRKHNLEKHHLVHSGQKYYSCGDCGASFNAKQSLNRHKKCHVSARCDKCGCKFQQVRYLKLHRKSCRQSLETLKTSGDSLLSSGVIIKNEGFIGDGQRNTQ